MSRAFVVLALGHRDEALVLLRQSIAEGMAPPFQRWRNRFELVPLWATRRSRRWFTSGNKVREEMLF
jgi:hypothetical protein